jgi:hypothetical protein
MTAITSVISVSCSDARIVVLRSMAMRQLGRHIVDGLDDVGVRLAEENDEH